jgi:hypothetical protein
LQGPGAVVGLPYAPAEPVDGVHNAGEKMGYSGRLASLCAVLALSAAPAVHAQSDKEVIGWDDLAARLGALTPDGSGIYVAQIEGTVEGNYAPDRHHSEFDGKLFALKSGSSGVSNHATGVARRMYGNDTSIAPGVSFIYLYAAGGWVTDNFLRTGEPGTTNPAYPPSNCKMMNNSWVATFNDDATDNEALRRADFVVNRDGLIITSGVNNSGPGLPLMSHLFNGIAVGQRDGTHSTGATLAAIDVPGRMKPEIVAPGSATSFSTPIVNAAGTLLVETARTWDGLSDNPAAERPDVIKAVLMAGATHENQLTGSWSNEPEETGAQRGVTETPIDDVVGAGTVQVDRSHVILTAGEQDGSTSSATAPVVDRAGWDLGAVPVGGSLFWTIDVPELADEISILATWNRDIDGYGDADWSIADFDLVLWRKDGGSLVALTGPAGEPYFASGNVVSESLIDNVEHVFVRDLQPGAYVIELQRMDGLAGSWEAAVAWLLPEPPETPPCPWDISDPPDGTVGLGDLNAMLSNWGLCPDPPAECPWDLSVPPDGVVGLGDLNALLSNWGPCPD